MKAAKCPKCGARLVDEYCVWGHGIFGERAEAASREYWGDEWADRKAAREEKTA